MANRGASEQQRIGIQIEERRARNRLSSGWHRSRALICASALLGGLGSAGARAQMCGDTFLTQGNPTALIEVDTSTNPWSFNTLGTADVAYNGTAYRSENDTLYAIQGPDTLLQVGVDGSVTELGTVDGLPGSGYNVGAFGPDGFMYVAATPNDVQGNLFRIDIDARTAVEITLSPQINVSDISWFNGLFYGIDNIGDVLVSIDPDTGVVNAVGDTGITQHIGAMFSADNGVFGVANDGSGAYQFDLTTGEATLISDAPGSGNNDGARCLDATLDFEADLMVTKTDDSQTYEPGDDVVYEIVVTNSGPFGVQNAEVSDPLPDGITTASWSCVGTDGGVCGAEGGNGAIADTPNLPPAASVTYMLTLAVPGDFTGELVNTVTVDLPDGFLDPTPDNNTDTDVDESPEPVPALPPLAFVLLVTLLATATLWILRRARA